MLFQSFDKLRTKLVPSLSKGAGDKGDGASLG
jgi:hypothetical protein